MTCLRLVLKGHTQPEKQRNNKSLSSIKTQLQIRLSSQSKQTKQHVIKSDKPSSSWTYRLVRFVNWNRIGGKGPVKGFVDIDLHETNQLIHANKWAVADASLVVLNYGVFLSLSCILMTVLVVVAAIFSLQRTLRPSDLFCEFMDSGRIPLHVKQEQKCVEIQIVISSGPMVNPTVGMVLVLTSLQGRSNWQRKRGLCHWSYYCLDQGTPDNSVHPILGAVCPWAPCYSCSWQCQQQSWVNLSNLFPHSKEQVPAKTNMIEVQHFKFWTKKAEKLKIQSLPRRRRLQ